MIEWISENKAEVIAIITSTFVVLQTIVRLTPTPKDDEVVNKIWKVLSLILQGTRTKK